MPGRAASADVDWKRLTDCLLPFVDSPSAIKYKHMKSVPKDLIAHDKVPNLFLHIDRQHNVDQENHIEVGFI